MGVLLFWQIVFAFTISKSTHTLMVYLVPSFQGLCTHRQIPSPKYSLKIYIVCFVISWSKLM